MLGSSDLNRISETAPHLPPHFRVIRMAARLICILNSISILNSMSIRIAIRTLYCCNRFYKHRALHVQTSGNVLPQVVFSDLWFRSVFLWKTNTQRKTTFADLDPQFGMCIVLDPQRLTGRPSMEAIYNYEDKWIGYPFNFLWWW